MTLSCDQLSKNNSFYSLGAMAESLDKKRKKKKIKISLYTILAQNLCYVIMSPTASINSVQV